MISYFDLELQAKHHLEQYRAEADRDRLATEARRAQAIAGGGRCAALTARFPLMRLVCGKPAALALENTAA